MQKKHIVILIITGCLLTAAAIGMFRQSRRRQDKPQTVSVARRAPRPAPKKTAPKPEPQPKPEPVPTLPDTLTGTLLDTDGQPVARVTVSDGHSCTQTDSLGRYTLRRDSTARFVYYTVPSDCAVPTHSDTDRTADFYLRITPGRSVYDFTLTRLPGGKETHYRMIVIGDPQVTNAINPYYTGPDDNPVRKTDLERFTTETMTDIRQTIARWPAGTPVYGLSMGDDVQYYGGYNARLERGIREALGSSDMRLFSVIGNHDQDGNARYLAKWEESWGPADYSFDRGDEHYVCLNNVRFYRKAQYYSPGELTDAQMEWLRQDLALTDREKKVVLCYHIPLTFGNAPYAGATPLDVEGEDGHYASSRLGELLGMLDTFGGGYELFCGHTHFALNHEIFHDGRHVMEHCHAAACGDIWQSNINICGTPNGYYIYSFDGTRLTDCRYKGTRWDQERQMTLFWADTDFNGESYARDWQLPVGRRTVVANVFNADSRWRIVAIEDGKEYPMARLSGKGQDAFAAGYHHKYAQCAPFSFISKANGYLLMNHLYYYETQSPHSHVIVRATDPYGHTYVAASTEAVTMPFYNFAHYYK